MHTYTRWSGGSAPGGAGTVVLAPRVGRSRRIALMLVVGLGATLVGVPPSAATHDVSAGAVTDEIASDDTAADPTSDVTAPDDPADAIVTDPGCRTSELAANDDLSTGRVELPFEFAFYGDSYDSLFVNNNGNVTFDAPLATYTPFELESTNRVIVAPFFADVDTRGSGSDTVRYGVTEEPFLGRPAFCVDYLDVGYFAARDDRLNSFQLLFVDRSDIAPGDVDIVFNYRSISWETGDASGGQDGLGGSPARVGFSNGDAQAVSSFELPGSGISGAFLDGSAGELIGRTRGSNVPGRLVFPIRGGEPPPSTYVAMGDSYASGLGAGDYDPDTDRPGLNQCWRSSRAYAHLLVDQGRVPYDLDFVACQFAFVRSLSTGMWDEPPQFDALGEDTALVTLSIGGNDSGFASVLEDCVRSLRVLSHCHDDYDEQVRERLDELTSVDPGSRLNPLQGAYAEVKDRAWRADGIVVGYPRFFEAPTDVWQGLRREARRCGNIRFTDQLWIDARTRELNTAIEHAAVSMGLDYLDSWELAEGHELCADGEPFLNGITFGGPEAFTESFHPTAFGHQRWADAIADRVGPARPEPDLRIAQDETRSILTPIISAPSASFVTRWPGSDIVTTLTSPSGVVYARGADPDDARRRTGPTFESITITDPEPGEWQVELFGADVSGDLEDVWFTTVAEPEANEPPVAVVEVERSGATVTVDASGSHDPDGEVVDHLWEFDDGELRTGEQVTYTYDEPGTYRITLAVRDDRGAIGTAAADVDVVIPETPGYDLEAFLEPVGVGTDAVTLTAGRALPLRFSLGGDHGLDVLADGSPSTRQVTCDGEPGDAVDEATTTAGASRLSYDPSSEVYTYVWKTDRDWRGTCRLLDVRFDDGSSRSLLATFR
jgi:hypothetical protein